MPPPPKKRPAPAAKKKSAGQPAKAPQKKTAPKQQAPQKKRPAQTKAIPRKAPAKPKAKQSAPRQEERVIPKKKGGFFSKLIKLIVLIVLIGGGYYAYIMYESLAKDGKQININNIRGAVGSTNKRFTKDINKGIKTVKEKSIIVWDATAEKRLALMDMSKDSWTSLESKMKEIGEISSGELTNMADNYLVDVEDEKFEERKVVAHKTKDYKGEIIAEKERERLAKERKDSLNKQRVSLKTPPRVNKLPTTTKPETGFVTPEIKKTTPPRVTKSKPKKSSEGLKLGNATAGKTNQDAIRKPRREVVKKTKKPTKPKSQPAHMKKYYEGRKLFMEGLAHFKKASPANKQSVRRINNKQAFYKFKKASKIFVRLEKKMAGHKEYEKISVDTFRFIHACGKTMLISDH